MYNPPSAHTMAHREHYSHIMPYLCASDTCAQLHSSLLAPCAIVNAWKHEVGHAVPPTLTDTRYRKKQRNKTHALRISLAPLFSCSRSSYLREYSVSEDRPHSAGVRPRLLNKVAIANNHAGYAQRDDSDTEAEPWVLEGWKDEEDPALVSAASTGVN